MEDDVDKALDRHEADHANCGKAREEAEDDQDGQDEFAIGPGCYDDVVGKKGTLEAS